MIPFRCTAVGYKESQQDGAYLKPRNMVITDCVYIADLSYKPDFNNSDKIKACIRLNNTFLVYVLESPEEIANAIEARVVK